jgi:hypothetical protein
VVNYYDNQKTGLAMPYVIEATKHGHDDRYIGQSDVTQQLYWTRSLRNARKFHDLEVVRHMLYNVMDDENNRDISVLVAAFGLLNVPGPHTVVLKVKEIMPSGTLGDFFDFHGIRYEIKKGHRVTPIPVPA